MQRKKGSILVLTMFLSSLLVLLGGLILQMAVLNLVQVEKTADLLKVEWIAKSGLSQQVYNLRKYYFENQYKYFDGTYGGGTYKVGTAAIIGQGFHKNLVACIGEYNGTKKTLMVAIEMNTPTDFLHYVKGNQNYAGARLAGPVYVEGNCIVGRTWESLWFIKNAEDYGPNLRVTGILFSGPAGTYDQSCAFGEGTIPQPWTFNITNYNSDGLFWASKSSAYGGSIPSTDYWKGLYDPGSGINLQVPYPYDKAVGETKVTHTTPDGVDYSYNIVEDQRSGVTPILKIPNTWEITKAQYENKIDKDWIITKAAPGKAKLINIINENVQAGQLHNASYSPRLVGENTDLGIVNFQGGTFNINFPTGVDKNHINYVSFKAANQTYLTTFVGSFQTNMTSYTIDRSNRKFTFKYPVEWDDFLFTNDPVGGYWVGRRPSSDSVACPTNNWGASADRLEYAKSNGFANQSISITALYEYYSGVRNLPTPVIHGSFGNLSYPVKVSILDRHNGGTGEPFWTEVPDLGATTLSIRGFTTPLQRAQAKVFRGDYFNGSIIFGDGLIDGSDGEGVAVPVTNPAGQRGNASGNGAVPYGNNPELVSPPLPAPPARLNDAIRVSFYHGFPTPINAFTQQIVTDIGELDLSSIDENDRPKDPSDPNNAEKSGVIYSEIPLLIYGTPKAPVTIVCENDVYVGPVNSDYLDKTLHMKYSSLKENDERAIPVGIITKGIFWQDFAYAPWHNSTQLLINPAGTYNNNFVCTGGIYKYLQYNKVAIFYSYRNINTPISQAGYGSSFEFVNGISGATATQPSWEKRRTYNQAIRFIGTLFANSANTKVLKKMTDLNINDAFYSVVYGTDVIYPSSFRIDPPKHLPKTINIANVYVASMANMESVEDFLTTLQDLIASGQTNSYTPDLCKSINEVLADMEK